MSSPDNHNKLNLFKFVSKRKHSEASSSSGHPPASSQDSEDPNWKKGDHNLSDIDTPERDDSYPPESFYNQEGELISSYPMVHSNSEASLIFERNVEDPSPLLSSCPRCGVKSSNGQLKCNHQSIVNLPSHYSTENFISPCLDASAKILTDDATDLDNVDMVYSRRPSSVMGLEAALGRTRSYSSSINNGNNSNNNNNYNQGTSPTSPGAQRTQSFANVQDLSSNSNSSRPPILSFYSYADVINNENPTPRRPSISQSLSSSFLNSPRSNSISTQNNFGNSITPHRNQSRQSFSSPFVTQPPQFPSQQRGAPKKFSLDTGNSPNSSDSESDYNPLTMRRSISSRKSTSIPQVKRSNSNLPNINTNVSPLNRTYSNQSSFVSNVSRRYSNLNDISDVSDSESFVISSIGDELRKNTGEIESN